MFEVDHLMTAGVSCLQTGCIPVTQRTVSLTCIAIQQPSVNFYDKNI